MNPAVPNKVCTHEECNAPIHCRGMCKHHYAQWYHHNVCKKRKNEAGRIWYEKNKAYRRAQIDARRGGTPLGRWYRLAARKDKQSSSRLQITKEDFVAWATAAGDHCEYCGDVIGPGGHGVDRIDSSKGYMLGNIVTCCKRCNAAKSDMPLSEWIERTTKLYEAFQRKAGKTN